MSSMRTPLKSVRRLGSAKEGASHFLKQRVTGAANLVLSVFLVGFLVTYSGADHATVKAGLQSPFVAVPLALLILSAAIHMRLGMQTIIEDYVQSEGLKIVALLLNTFFAIAVGAAGLFAVLKLSLGV